jgi:hypothetical protein
MVLTRHILRHRNHQVTLSPRPRATALRRAPLATRAHRIGAWCHIDTHPQVIIQVIIVQGGSRLAPNAIRTPIQYSMKFRHLIARRTRHIVLSAILANIGVAMAAPPMRDTRIAANQVAIELAAVTFD